MPEIENRRETLLAGLTKTQLERLSHIDFKLYFLGELRRADVADRFGTGPAAKPPPAWASAGSASTPT